MPTISKATRYEEEDIDLEALSARCVRALGVHPFDWQLKAAATILAGEDLILDVGTGSGKTLCFALPILQDTRDIALVVSPLSALMVNQVESSRIPAVAVCEETISQGLSGTDGLYKDIASGKFRQVYVSPEISVSAPFRQQVLLRPSFYHHLRVVCIDEAHCISLWGGNFRPEYSLLGSLRGAIPANVPFLVSSATFPDHILDDIRVKLALSLAARKICMTNARPNVALSVRPMRHSDESKADLRFVIPADATTPQDIPVTLVYCNTRLTCEDIVDRLRGWLRKAGLSPDASAFYHAKIGNKRKRDLEEKLSKGDVRILVCTDAVGMGCDMRNIERVVLWGVPPSFCALVQRAGRAARDLSKLGEAILIVPAKQLKETLSQDEVASALDSAVAEARADTSSMSTQAQIRVDGEDIELAAADGDPSAPEDGSAVSGIRAERNVEPDDAEETASTGRSGTVRKKRSVVQCNTLEARYLTLFIQTEGCRRIIWDTFFQNQRKIQLKPGVNTTYRPLAGMQCCDNCAPNAFPIQTFTISSEAPSFRRGRKKQLPARFESLVREQLKAWRDSSLVTSFFPGSASLMTGEMILPDTVIEQLATAGSQLLTPGQLARITRWPHAYVDASRQDLSATGKALVEQLREAYKRYTYYECAAEVAVRCLPSVSGPIPPASFYGTQSSSAAEGSAREQQPTSAAHRGRGTTRGTSRVKSSRGGQLRGTASRRASRGGSTRSKTRGSRGS
ncbi:P-loop containing nucleoside triphosphate hydrolase protein [Ganoderma leucocontextum]|nr:P-loop containing nucleoside triphosphate hydrolase protein [Ganoderma leucocontextum]